MVLIHRDYYLKNTLNNHLLLVPQVSGVKISDCCLSDFQFLDFLPLQVKISEFLHKRIQIKNRK